MNISSTPAVQAATSSASQGPTADAVQILVLKKALDAQAAMASTLIASLPATPLATEGSLGTQLNTWA